MRPLRKSSMAALSVCGVTPASLKKRAASVPFFKGEREQQPLDGDVRIAGLLRELLGIVEKPCRRLIQRRLFRPLPRDFRQLGQRRLGLGEHASRERPPARSMRPADRPCSSSSSTFNTCSGVSCGLPSRVASDNADCTKPCARVVYLSKSWRPPPAFEAPRKAARLVPIWREIGPLRRPLWPYGKDPRARKEGATNWSARIFPLGTRRRAPPTARRELAGRERRRYALTHALLTHCLTCPCPIWKLPSSSP